MANTKALKLRIRSIKNTKQITKAMELVAASRLRRVQEAAKASREYSQIAYSLLHRVSRSVSPGQHPYFNEGKSKQNLYIVFTSDRGLAGAFNSSVQGAVIKALKADRENGLNSDVIVFGRKGASFFANLKDTNLVGVYEKIDDTPSPEVFGPLFSSVDHATNEGQYQRVWLVFNQFISTLKQEVQVLPILPVKLDPEVAASEPVFDFEPDAKIVLEKAAQLYIQSQIMQARIDSAASEHAARMLAMSSATKNAEDLVDNLTLELNATRQASITQEIAEITGGAAAIAT